MSFHLISKLHHWKTWFRHWIHLLYEERTRAFVPGSACVDGFPGPDGLDEVAIALNRGFGLYDLIFQQQPALVIRFLLEFPAQAGVIRELPMGKRGRKKRSRKGNAANHGKRPNA